MKLESNIALNQNAIAMMMKKLLMMIALAKMKMMSVLAIVLAMM